MRRVVAGGAVVTSPPGWVPAPNRVDDKSNEITAIPKLLSMLDLVHRPIDAMGCQKDPAISELGLLDIICADVMSRWRMRGAGRVRTTRWEDRRSVRQSDTTAPGTLLRREQLGTLVALVPARMGNGAEIQHCVA